MTERFGLDAVRVALLVAGLVAGLGAGYLARGSGVTYDAEFAAIDGQLSALSAAVEAAAVESAAGLAESAAALAEQATRITALTDENASLAATVTQKDVIIRDLNVRLLHSGASVSELEALTVRFDALTADHATAEANLSAALALRSELETEHQALIDRWEPVVLLDSAGVAENALLFDPTKTVTVDRALCTGSMEPGIGCSDLIFLFTPNASELAAGDVIKFRRPTDDCSATVAGQFVLHRITGVIFGADDGLQFLTKGDANAIADRCLVSSRDVVGKLLAVLYNTTIP